MLGSKGIDESWILMEISMDGRAIDKKYIIGFGLYDFSNSAYILIFNAFLFPIYFREVVFLNDKNSDFYWGLSLSISILSAVLLSPFIGLVADRTNRKKILLYLILAVTIGMVFLSTLNSQNKLLYTLFFILTNMCYILSLSIYDSFLPYVSTTEKRALVSGFGWGLGYLGGILCFVLVLISKNFGASYQSCFLITAIFYIIFSLLSISLLPSIKGQPFNESFIEISKTILNRKILILLLAFFLINESIHTIIYFSSLYGRFTIGIEINEMGYILLGIQLIAFPSTWIIGLFASRKGEKRIINYTLVVWIIIIILIIMAKSFTDIIFVAILTGFVIGSTQALLRSYFSLKFLDKFSGFFFGFYSIVTRASSLLGPVIFGAISSLSGSQRLAALSILVPLVIGGIIFSINES